MCGIVGYVGYKPAQDILLGGLEKLEYRGYDSAGISLLEEGELRSVRAVGNLSRLVEAVRGEGGGVATATKPATTGIGHTRWATHGRVTEENAHPHYDMDNRVHVVVNGIVENYLELKQELQATGAEFSSETDVEVIAHLVSRELERGDGLIQATLRAYARLDGQDRKSTRLNSSHANISYAVFCLKKKNIYTNLPVPGTGLIDSADVGLRRGLAFNLKAMDDRPNGKGLVRSSPCD